MSSNEIKILERGLLRQRKEIGRSKKAATQLLKELNIFHLLVPKAAAKDQREVIVRK